MAVKESPISGQGVFATENIKKGDTVYVLGGELCSLDEIIRRVKKGLEEPSDPLGVDDEKYLDLNEFSRTFNHSCDPNCYIKGESQLVAIRDIPAGEELTYDYSTTMNDNEDKIVKAGLKLWTCKCNCGSLKCRGIIDQFNTLSKERREFYVQSRFMPDFMLARFG